MSTITGVASNTATAKVEVTGGVFTDRGIIAGKIFVDCACDPDRVQGARDIGIPGVRIMLEDGTSTVTDVEGKFNFYGLAPRMHVLKVDVTTLPPGARLAAVSSRNAGDGWTRFVDLRNSEFARGDFVEVSNDAVGAGGGHRAPRPGRGHGGDPGLDPDGDGGRLARAERRDGAGHGVPAA